MSGQRGYTQVKLRAEGPVGYFHVAWIPSEFAAAGKRVTIDGLVPECVWIVDECYGSAPRDQAVAYARESVAWARGRLKG